MWGSRKACCPDHITQSRSLNFYRMIAINLREFKMGIRRTSKTLIEDTQVWLRKWISRRWCPQSREEATLRTITSQFLTEGFTPKLTFLRWTTGMKPTLWVLMAMVTLLVQMEVVQFHSQAIHTQRLKILLNISTRELGYKSRWAKMECSGTLHNLQITKLTWNPPSFLYSQ